ncbi:hypothetical protein BRADI_5g08735v3 [Brachypodium distachyon]|uniref:Reverse transcriptase zinc-binding domain-containing protein n=1 Tax=Brachypodium distachyon TaxID=15368 RepID=A0A2K2CG17_BRADI|nr:hypothetical protein BRADI_5g08735v3 [Brachypodium distachyon]
MTAVDHLFLECPVAKFVWRVVCCSLGISKGPSSMNNMYRWVSGFPFSIHNIISIGLSVVCWSIWKARSLLCFQNKSLGDPANLVFSVCYWLDYCTSLQNPESRRRLQNDAVVLRAMVTNVLGRSHGWGLLKRLAAG